MSRARTAHVSLAILAIMAVVAAAGAVLWSKSWKWEFIPKRWEVVDQGAVYRSGNVAPGLLKKTWEDNGIKVVVVLGRDKPGKAQHEAERQVAAELGIERPIYLLGGNGLGDPASYVGALRSVADARRDAKPVVVHCAEGVYRTGGVIAVYRVLFDGWTGPNAYSELIDHGVDADSALIKYLNDNLPGIASSLVEQGVLERVPDPLPVFSAGQ